MDITKTQKIGQRIHYHNTSDEHVAVVGHLSRERWLMPCKCSPRPTVMRDDLNSTLGWWKRGEIVREDWHT